MSVGTLRKCVCVCACVFVIVIVCARVIVIACVHMRACMRAIGVEDICFSSFVNGL